MIMSQLSIENLQPRAVIVVAMVAMLYMFGKLSLSIPESFYAAEKFVDEAEKRYGKIGA
jgi:hypothetical protein